VLALLMGKIYDVCKNSSSFKGIGLPQQFESLRSKK
jgi:hypothetical protein